MKREQEQHRRRLYKPSNPDVFPAPPTSPGGDGDEVRVKMREMALSSHYYMAKTVLGYRKLRPEPHGEMCRFLDFLEDQREAGNYDLNRSAVYMPRDTYKTTIATITRGIKLGLKHPNIRILIIADIAENAELFGTEISNHFKHNTLLRWLFQDLIPPNFNTAKWSTSAMSLERTEYWRDPTWTLIGAFGGSESRHFDRIIPDDLVVEKHLRSNTEMDKLIHWMGGLEPLLVNDVESCIDFVGSRKKKGDAYERQEKYYGASNAMPIQLGPHAEKRGGMCIYSRQIIEEGKNIFPYSKELKSGISNKYITRMRRNEPQRFWAQLMNSPKGTGLNTFRIEDVNFFTIGPRGEIECVVDGKVVHQTNVWAMDRRILYDPAVAEQQTSSMQAIHVIAKGSHPFRFVLESHVGHIPPDEAIELLFALDKKWQPQFVSIEKRGFQGWVKYSLDMIAERDGVPYIPYVEWPPVGSANSQFSKGEHIRGLQPVVRAGWLWMQSDQHELLEQVEFHPNTRWDDALDALAQDLDYAPYAEDDDVRVEKAKQEDRLLAQVAGGGRPGRDYGALAEGGWSEREFLKRFDRTGYAHVSRN